MFNRHRHVQRDKVDRPCALRGWLGVRIDKRTTHMVKLPSTENNATPPVLHT